MAGSVTVTLVGRCDTGNGKHLTFSVTGAKTMTIVAEVDDLLSPFTDEEAAAFVKGMGKLGKIGRTNGQLLTLFQNGATVTV